MLVQGLISVGPPRLIQETIPLTRAQRQKPLKTKIPRQIWFSPNITTVDKLILLPPVGFSVPWPISPILADRRPSSQLEVNRKNRQHCRSGSLCIRIIPIHLIQPPPSALPCLKPEKCSWTCTTSKGRKSKPCCMAREPPGFTRWRSEE